MATISRCRVLWTGFPGAPGVSTFYFTDPLLGQASLNDFMAEITIGCPTDVTTKVETGGEDIDETTGELVSTWTGTDRAVHTGTSSVAYAAPAGYTCRWLTGLFVGGRRLAGRTYVVPSGAVAFQTDGSVSTSLITGIEAAQETFVNDHTNNLLIWSRPRAATPAWTDRYGKTHAAVSSRAGSSAPVNDWHVPDRAVVLRSRRD